MSPRPPAYRVRGRALKWRLLLFAASALASAQLSRPADACTRDSPLVPTSYIVGRPLVEGPDGLPSRNYPPIPRNAAFLEVFESQPPASFAIAVDSATRNPIFGHVVRRLYAASITFTRGRGAAFFAKADEPLPSGLLISATSGSPIPPTYLTGDYIDEKPPETPEISYGYLVHSPASGTCDASTSVSFTLTAPGIDDHASTDLLAYAFYMGKSSVEARDASEPFALVAGWPHRDGRTLGTFVDHDWKDSHVYIAVSAIDHAGNESQRSNVFRVYGDEETGCACQLQRTQATARAVVVPLLAVAAWARKRARSRQSSQ